MPKQDTTASSTFAPASPTYDDSDLRYFQNILKQVYEELWDQSAAKQDEARLLVSMASALFRCAATGERDYDRLKLSAASAVLNEPGAKPGDHDVHEIKPLVSLRLIENT